MDGEEKTYGGCEGPDAMYVKLISSDGHEFIVKREHALTSGTIKAMLSGPGQFAENETNECWRLNSMLPMLNMKLTTELQPHAPGFYFM
uniref:Transcription elongation factor B polypeptide 1 isoform X2 n=1 Tax=Castor canadensis TaxID=51338 RepID=A0A8B7V9N2_CASCN|nr:transcription elongation factor B polypeptide 1 isoform X2 [Castor canadensis]